MDGTKLFTLFTPKTGCWHVKPRNKSGVPGLADPKITKPKCWDEWKPVETTGQLTVNRSTAQGSKMMLDGDAWIQGKTRSLLFLPTKPEVKHHGFTLGCSCALPCDTAQVDRGCRSTGTIGRNCTNQRRQALAWSLGENIARCKRRYQLYLTTEDPGMVDNVDIPTKPGAHGEVKKPKYPHDFWCQVPIFRVWPGVARSSSGKV